MQRPVFLEGADPSPEEEAEEGSGAGAGGPREFLIFENGTVDAFYSIGRLPLKEEGTFCSFAAIALVHDQLLVAVPHSVWHKKPRNRQLDSKALSKPALIAVAACEEEGREEISEACPELRVWVGFLSSEIVERAEYLVSAEGETQITFGGADSPNVLPLANALVEVAQEHFGFLTAESGGGVAVEAPDPDQRLSALESSMGRLEKGLEELLAAQKADAPRRPALRNPAAGLATSGRKKAPEVGDAVPGGAAKTHTPGLDPSVVQSALSSGVPLHHLQEMGKLLGEKPKNMADLPRGAEKATGPLSESEEDELEEAVAEGGDAAGSGGNATLNRAVLQLTKIASMLSKGKEKKSDLESLLEGSGSAGSSGDGSLPASRRNAAALKALQKALTENPRFVFESIEANMQADFLCRPVAPGEPLAAGVTARGWLCSRSRVQNYTNHVRWTWAVAGIWDSLMRNCPMEARARCAVLVSAADQASIDAGSWLMSQVALLETAPPYQAFSQHAAPTNQDLQHTALLDSRWVDIYLSHLKEVDSYQEAKKKLGKIGRSPKEDDPPKVPKVKPAPKVKAAAKQRASNAGQAAEEET